MMTEFELPRTPIIGDSTSVRRLLIFSQPKVGKTSSLLQIPNNLVIDLEGGAEKYDGLYIDIPKLCSQQGKGPVTVLREISAKIATANKDNGSPIYDYITIDPISDLEDWSRKYATSLYKKTVIGKDFKGSDVVSELAMGAGYAFLRTAFKDLYCLFDGLPAKCLILSGHAKDASIKKEGKDLTARDISLTGKLKLMIAGKMDAIGYMYRDATGTKNILSFKTSEDDIVTGARNAHLANKEFVISEMKDGKLVTYWNEIFIS
jgi:hypothetical protein